VNEALGDPRLELVRAGQLALERSDRDAFCEVTERLMHPGGVWEPLLTGVEGGPYQGPHGVVRWFDDFMSAFEVRYESRAQAMSAAGAVSATSAPADAGWA
jgi:hypothetical protein